MNQARQIVSEEWGKVVKEHNLRPGSVVETVIARIINRLDAEAPMNEIGRAYAIEHDGFVGEVIGSYTTREGRRGVVLQQFGTRVVHVYGKRFLGIPRLRDGNDIKESS